MPRRNTSTSARSLLVLVLVAASALMAHPPANPGSNIEVGPYLQDASPHGIWILWETNGGTESRVDYGTTTELGSTATGTWTTSEGNSRIHETPLTGLDPGTIYFYRVQTGSSQSSIHYFRTPQVAAAEESFRFGAYSDTQLDGGNPTKHQEIVDAGIIPYLNQQYGGSLPEKLAFMICAGDLVSTGSTHSHWQDHFWNQAHNLYRHVPLYAALGNHEVCSSLYWKYLHLPLNGTFGYEENWYYKDYQNLRLIGLDTECGPQSVQLDWLDDTLASAAADDDIDFVFAQFHRPHKSELWTPGESSFSTQIVERLEQFSTDTGKPSIHFFGHTHGYSRGQSRDHNHLWVNIATGMGNPDYWWEYPQADYAEFQYSEPDWGFAIIDVEAGDDPLFRLRRISRGNEYVFRNNEVTDEITIRRYNANPETPMPIAPNPASDPVPGFDVVLKASDFLDPDPGDTLLESHWQVTTRPGDYGDPVADEWRRIENWYRPANGDGWYSVNTVEDPDVTRVELTTSLPGCRPVYWRVRYRDSSLGWSDWSPEMSFTVGESDAGDSSPEPENGAESIAVQPVLEWFPCEPADSYDVYFGTTPSPGPEQFQGNQAATTFMPGTLEELTPYYWRIDRHDGSTITPGNTWSFTTTQTFPGRFTAEWRFGDGAPGPGIPLVAAYGSSELIPTGMTYGSDWTLGTTDGTTVPHIQDVPATYIRLDNVSGCNTGLKTWYNVPGNGGGGCCDVFEFTLIYDLYFDASQGELQALWQGNASNCNDAEFFMNSANGGFYVYGSGHVGSGSWTTGAWVRIAHRVDYNETSAVFVNGEKVLDDDELAAPDWLYGLGSGNPVWMLTDDDGGNDVSIVYCANLAIVEGLMDDAAVAALGGANAEGIFLPHATCPGDFDGGGVIDFGDLLSMLSAWGPCTACPEDLDSDGLVSFNDLLNLLSDWGPCPSG